MELQELERHFGLTLPNAYRIWCQNGYITPKRENKNYLWVSDAEWLRIDEIPIRNMWRENLIAGLIPFAFTGGGDNWCWNTTSKSVSGEYEVLLWYRDDDLADAYAPTFPRLFLPDLP